MKKRVVFGFLGQQRDAGDSRKEGKGWRPTVAVALQPDFFVDRIEIFYHSNDLALLETVESDIKVASPQVTVVKNLMEIKNPWDFQEVYGKLYDFFVKYPFQQDSEEYFINMTTGTHVAHICLFLLMESLYIPGNLLQMLPPGRDGPEKCIGSYNIVDLDLSKYDQLAARFSMERFEATSKLKSGIPTKNKAYNELIDEIEKVVTARTSPVLRHRSLRKKPAEQALPAGPEAVLLIGATGVGKSQLARRIYEVKRERKLLEGEFVEVNCATLKGTHSMSALFGHEAGAYTGAEKERKGYLRSADGGILFLDEIGELGLDEQAMLLRAIEERRFQPLGRDTDVSSNFQLIAGTNRDLDAEVQAGRFREDLLARIDLWTFRLPKLVERREDIEPNVDYELRKFAASRNLKVGFNKEARQRFLGFAYSPGAVWRANFRDLNAAIVRMSTLSTGGRIGIENVEKEIERLANHWKKRDQGPQRHTLELLGLYLNEEQIDRIDLFDRTQLAEVIRVCGESKTLSEAGRKLYQFSRTQKGSSNDASRLRKYLERFGLKWGDLQR